MAKPLNRALVLSLNSALNKTAFKIDIASRYIDIFNFNLLLLATP